MPVADELKIRIKQVVVSGLGLKLKADSIRDDESFFAGGLNLDPAEAPALAAVLEDKFKVKIKDNELERLTSVNQVAEFLIDKST